MRMVRMLLLSVVLAIGVGFAQPAQAAEAAEVGPVCRHIPTTCNFVEDILAATCEFLDAECTWDRP